MIDRRNRPVPPMEPPLAKIADRRAVQQSPAKSAVDAKADFDQMDRNKDSKVSEAELPDPMKPVLSRMDTNGDKCIDRDEWNRGAKTWTQHAETRLQSGGGQ